MTPIKERVREEQRTRRRWKVEMSQNSSGLFFAWITCGQYVGEVFADTTMSYARQSAVIADARRLVHSWLKLQRRIAK